MYGSPEGKRNYRSERRTDRGYQYLGIMVMEAGRDTEALYTTDTVNVIEAMGRNTGWIAAGTAISRRSEEDAPTSSCSRNVPSRRRSSRSGSTPPKPIPMKHIWRGKKR